MGVKPDLWIKEKSIKENMIFPFVDTQISDGITIKK
jgi:hypothetical protein